MSEQGALQFARYAYPPNALGYCGPEGAGALLGGIETEIERRARQFDGAWVYLEVLAEAPGVDDPLAAEVVAAYWVGSDLLDELDPGVLHARLRERFADQVGGTWLQAEGRARAHHSFQVFEVYPWGAMLLRGLPPGPAVSVLDRCRIRTGVVQQVDEECATVATRVLAWQGGRLLPGAPTRETVRWSLDGRTLLEPPAEGDEVALHWDWVCDVLTDEQAGRIESLEADQRSAVGLG